MNALVRAMPSGNQCCDGCSALLTHWEKPLLSLLSGSIIRGTAAPGCELCTLLRQACSNGHMGLYQRVLRGKATDTRLLRVFCDTGLSSTRPLRARSMLTHTSNAVNPDQAPSSIPYGLPTISNADGRPEFGLLRAWLDWCDTQHKCNDDHSGGDSALPTRLLYVGAASDPSYDPNFLRLDFSSQIQAGKYIALSHRWGELSVEEKEQFCTSKKNIEQRQGGFSLVDLPKTFQDAVEVTRQLRILYLWIDSLCIIQYGDNGEDWRREAQHMELVFSAAYCTIAATSATGCNSGFIERAMTTESVYVESATGKRFCVSTDIDDFDKDVGEAELNKRAWVLQESVLARRTIHFTTNQIYFECGEGVYCENLTKLRR
jgi:hypothetical protein